MKDLKQNIDKTETLKNNLKTVTNQIKQSIVRGGSDFKSLAGVPQRINKMLGQYKKIAVIERDDRVALNGSWKTSRINISLAFNPSRLLVLCYSFRGDNYIIVDSQKNNTEATATKGTNSLIYINNVTSNGFTIGARSTYDGQTIAIRQIIAIG